MVWFRPVQSSLKVPTWWRSNYSRGLIGSKVLCIGFNDIFELVQQYTLKLFVVLTTFYFLPTILSGFWVGLSSYRKPVLGIIINRHCYLDISPQKVEILDQDKLSGILVICWLKNKIQGIDNQEAQGHWISQWFHQVILINGTMLSMLLKNIIL